MTDKKFLFAYTLCWLLWIGVQAWVLESLALGFGWESALIDSVVSNALLALSGLIAARNLKYYRPGRGRYLYLVIWNTARSAIITGVTYWLLTHLLAQAPGYIYFLQKSLPVRFCLAFLISGWMTMLGWIWYGKKEEEENEMRKAEAARLTREAELFRLRQQLQPHFLFNSLNSISALAGSRPEEARHMIQQLSDFLRGTLRIEEEQVQTLKEEMQHVQLYLDIEKVRFGHRLSTIIELAEGSENYLLPSLLLQPLVENAIKFGLYDTIGEVVIHITSRLVNNELHVVIQNPFDETTAQALPGAGFGLASVKRRLFLLYARTDLLETKKEVNQFIILVKVPQQERLNKT